ncbi:MAG: Fur family transcriptional regulator [Chloroflexota bacterium]
MSELERIIAMLRQDGERLTIQRKLVLEALVATQAHMTINDVSHYIESQQSQSIAEPTIYRILQWLKEHELVSQTDMAESGIVYQIIGQQRHHHLVCLNCDKTIDISDAIFNTLRDRLFRDHQFEARIDHMAIYGYCRDCETVKA